MLFWRHITLCLGRTCRTTFTEDLCVIDNRFTHPRPTFITSKETHIATYTAYESFCAWVVCVSACHYLTATMMTTRCLECRPIYNFCDVAMEFSSVSHVSLVPKCRPTVWGWEFSAVRSFVLLSSMRRRVTQNGKREKRQKNKLVFSTREEHSLHVYL